MKDEKLYGQLSPNTKISAPKVLTWMGILACGSIITAAGLFITVFVITIIQQATIFKNGFSSSSQDGQDFPCGANPTSSCRASQICNHWHKDWGDPPSYCDICTLPNRCVISDELLRSIKLGVIDQNSTRIPTEKKSNNRSQQ